MSRRGYAQHVMGRKTNTLKNVTIKVTELLAMSQIGIREYMS